MGGPCRRLSLGWFDREWTFWGQRFGPTQVFLIRTTKMCPEVTCIYKRMVAVAGYVLGTGKMAFVLKELTA